MIRTLVISLLLVIGNFSYGHQLHETQAMLEQGKVHFDRVIVKFKDEVQFNITTLISARQILRFSMNLNNKFHLRRLFKRNDFEYQLERDLFVPFGQTRPKKENYYYLKFQRNLQKTDALLVLRDLFANPKIDFAYFQPKAELATMDVSRPIQTNPNGFETQSSPNFEKKQHYLLAAPDGVDARYAWKFQGGAGKNVKVIDVETGWHVGHEDLKKPFWQNSRNNLSHHGSAVWGEVAAKKDAKGITGIAHNSNFGIAGIETDPGVDEFIDIAEVIDQASARLSAGDVLIIELHAVGPNSKYIAMEYWQAIFDAIRSASDKGIYVVAAAGNGDENFDLSIYQGKFDLKIRDSGSIIVGAANPSHWSRNSHRRCSFSNFGSRVDAYGFGWEVVTTGYGDLQNSANDLRDYTDQFSGTSSATPIVSGAVAALSGIAKAKGRQISPLELRAALRTTGTPQRGNRSQRIGNLPDLKSLISYFF